MKAGLKQLNRGLKLTYADLCDRRFVISVRLLQSCNGVPLIHAGGQPPSMVDSALLQELTYECNYYGRVVA
jgi:hypothetical protein